MIFLLSIFLHLGLHAAHAGDNPNGAHCAASLSESTAAQQPSSEAPEDDNAAARFDHCANCPMAAQLIDPPRIDFGVGERIVVRIVFNAPQQMEPRERRRSGEAQSRAPPTFS